MKKMRIKKIVLLSMSLVLLALQIPSNAVAGGVYVGGGAGLTSASSTSSSSSNVSEAIYLGIKPSPHFGIGGFYNLASTTSGNYSAFGGELDFYAGGRFFYVGPRVGSQSISSLSGMVYGGGTGINIPLGQMLSLGVDVSYLTGSVTLTVLGVTASSTISTFNAIANLKFWL